MGAVSLDTDGMSSGQTLAPDDLADSTPIVVNGQTVGRLLVSPAQIGRCGHPGCRVLTGVNRAVLLAAWLPAAWPWC